ncbi:polysaccharide deacetylase family protein [Primorskyibacter aestuariivivens]|uniref:polysaccharide deacetylase family protein n=1 Tax=Primorskyibacter aestuariivivens TaxID=1888912 RepID=UPI00230091AC|nr:polysaccharide deacetylase family protein [Primorskyibacter aestuariivivens]MDA7428609.1 polysaccharide deacetylase family protein [Primorskyibacter aestuariivivens]
MRVTRREALIGGAGFAAAGLLPAAAEARAMIALPNDIVERDAATITAVRTPSPVVAMTFDDGPHPRNTPRLLDMLRERNIKATFYLIGNRVVTWPEIAKRIADEGHEIGNHSWSHPFLNKLGNTHVLNEIDKTTMAIWNATGRPPVTFRPPYGAFTRAQRTWLHKGRKLPTVLWSVDPADWRRPGASVVARRILKHSHKGAIILSHDIHRGTIDAMPGTLDGLAKRGMRFVTVSQILGWPVWQTRRFTRVTS